jgi:hypothetical protein
VAQKHGEEGKNISKKSRKRRWNRKRVIKDMRRRNERAETR